MKVFHKSLNVAGETRSPCVLLSDLITPVGQDRQILTRSGAGAPELQSGSDASR